MTAFRPVIRWYGGGRGRRRWNGLAAVLLTMALLAGCAQPAVPTAAPASPSPTVAPPSPTTTVVPVAPSPSATAAPPVASTPPTAATAPTAPAAAPAATFVADNAYRHVEALATTIGIRAAGTAGEERAADYIAEQLTGLGYRVTRQPFPITSFRDEGATLTLQGPAPARLQPLVLQYSRAGQVTAPLVGAGIGAADDFAQGVAGGKIALVERGGLTFAEKARNARAGGALALIIFNNGDGQFQGSLGGPADLPVVALSRADGLRLRSLLQEGTTVEATLQVNAVTEERPSQNVVAVRPDVAPSLPIIVVGAHYDSVPAGPGANDNASGTGVLLELARVLAEERRAELRFVTFGAEEIGLVGSRAYVAALSREERGRIVAMINLDMLAVGPTLAIIGSDELVRQAATIAQGLGIRNVARASGGRDGGSDHASFMAVGIPAVFLNRLDDPNYHTARDLPEFVDREALAAAGTISARLIEHLLTR